MECSEKSPHSIPLGFAWTPFDSNRELNLETTPGREEVLFSAEA